MDDAVEDFPIALGGGGGTENAAAEGGAVERRGEGWFLGVFCCCCCCFCSSSCSCCSSSSSRSWTRVIGQYIQKQIFHPLFSSKVFDNLRICARAGFNHLARQSIGVDDGEVVG